MGLYKVVIMEEMGYVLALSGETKEDIERMYDDGEISLDGVSHTICNEYIDSIEEMRA